MVSAANGIKGRTDEYDLSYSSAKELFEACREARLRWFSTRERVNAYKLTEGAKTQKFNESVSSSKDPDVMRNGLTYEQVSSILCMSITSVFKYARIANETCDAYGLQRVAEGKGIANA